MEMLLVPLFFRLARVIDLCEVGSLLQCWLQRLQVAPGAVFLEGAVK